MSLGEVFNFLLDHLTTSEIFAVWQAVEEEDPSVEIVPFLCERMCLVWKPSYTMTQLYDKMMHTARCSRCGKPTRSVACKNLRSILLCGECGGKVLVSRKDIRDLVVTQDVRVRKYVTKRLWERAGLLRARRAPRGGSYLYWLDEVEAFLFVAKCEVGY